MSVLFKICLLQALLGLGQAASAIASEHFVPLFDNKSAIDDTATKAPASPTLIFSNDVRVNSPRISVADVARCQGDEIFCRRAVHIDLGLAALPGDKRTFTPTEIKGIVAAELPDASVSVEMPGNLIVRTNAQEIDKLQLEGYLNDYLAVKLRTKNDMRIRFARVLFAKKLRVLPGEISIDIPAITQLNADDPAGMSEQIAGRRVLDVICHAKGEAKEILTKASVHIELERILPTLRSSKVAGSLITHGDLEFRWLPLSRINAQALTKIEELAGKKLKHALRSGQPVPPNAIENISLVKRGAMVRVLIKNNGINISGEGKALASAGMGEEVKIVSASTKQSLLAKVVGENLVEVTQ